MKIQLPQDISNREIELGQVFQNAKKSGDMESAERALLEIWSVYPTPKGNYQGSTSLVTNISLFYLSLNKLQQAENWALEIFNCHPPDGYYKPYMVLGKIYYEMGDFGRAAVNLLKAYEFEGKRGFAGEDKNILNL